MTDHRRTRAARIRLVAALMTAGLIGAPAALGLVGGAAAGPQRPAQEVPATQIDEAGPRGELPIEVDVYRADEGVVGDTLESLTDNVGDQLADLDSARAAVSEAEAGVEEAQAVVSGTEERIDDLIAQSDEVAVEAFVNPPAESGLDALDADSLSEATVKQSILDSEATASADVLEELEAAREEFEVQKATEEEAVTDAEETASEAEAELADLEAAQSQQAVFVAQVQDRLDRRLAEADALEGMAPALAERIRRRESELATQIEEIRNAAEMQEALQALEIAQVQAEAEAQAEAERLAEAAEEAAAALGDIGGPSGSLADVACPGGGSITIDGAMASNLEAMLGAASADGYSLCGGGYRSPDEQVQLRSQNCGSSSYAIYEMPSSQCSPPTAKPGSSNHEQGLAVDFQCDGSLIQSQGSGCFQWLDAHAASYGFYNLPSEPWHWSNDGT